VQIIRSPEPGNWKEGNATALTPYRRGAFPCLCSFGTPQCAAYDLRDRRKACSSADLLELIRYMKSIAEFKVGTSYTNDEIRFALRVGNLGGIRPSVDDQGNLRHIAIMTSTDVGRHSDYTNPYNDRIEGDVLTFTGTGRSGDQGLVGANKRITEQLESAVPIFGFMNHGKQCYEFLGLLELLRWYPERQLGRSRELRSVWMFEFRIHRFPEMVPLGLAGDISRSLIAEKAANGSAELEVVEGAGNVAAADAIHIEDVRSHLLNVDPYRFEVVIKQVFEKYEFTNVDVTRRSGDGGIDVNAVVSEANSFFGGTWVQIQVKRWRHSVGSVEINNFRGAMSSTAKGIFVTTSYYTRAAIENAYHQHKSCVTLIDGSRLSNLVLKSGLDVRHLVQGAQ